MWDGELRVEGMIKREDGEEEGRGKETELGKKRKHEHERKKKELKEINREEIYDQEILYKQSRVDQWHCGQSQHQQVQG